MSTADPTPRPTPGTIRYPPAAEAALAAVAAAHDRECSVDLRHPARDALGMGRCHPRQECPSCGDAGEEA